MIRDSSNDNDKTLINARDVSKEHQSTKATLPNKVKHPQSVLIQKEEGEGLGGEATKNLNAEFSKNSAVRERDESLHSQSSLETITNEKNSCRDDVARPRNTLNNCYVEPKMGKKSNM